MVFHTNQPCMSTMKVKLFRLKMVCPNSRICLKILEDLELFCLSEFFSFTEAMSYYGPLNHSVMIFQKCYNILLSIPRAS